MFEKQPGCIRSVVSVCPAKGYGGPVAKRKSQQLVRTSLLVKERIQSLIRMRHRHLCSYRYASNRDNAIRYGSRPHWIDIGAGHEGNECEDHAPADPSSLSACQPVSKDRYGSKRDKPCEPKGEDQAELSAR